MRLFCNNWRKCPSIFCMSVSVCRLISAYVRTRNIMTRNNKRRYYLGKSKTSYCILLYILCVIIYASYCHWFYKDMILNLRLVYGHFMVIYYRTLGKNSNKRPSTSSTPHRCPHTNVCKH